MSTSIWPSNAILKIELLSYLSYLDICM